MDQPSNDGINTWFVCKTAKENGLKSLLSGLGADELFGGYPSFDRIHKIQNLNWLSKSTIRSTRFLKNSKLKRLYYLSMDSPIGEYLCLRGVYTPDVIAELLDIDMKTVMDCLENIPVDPHIKNLSNESRASWFEFNMYMQNQLLKDTDFMSMSHGVEIRVPFLDRNFVNLVLSISTEIKFNYEQKKRLLIEAYKDQLPPETWNRSKMGFTFPFQEWMRKNRDISDPTLYQNKTARALMNKFKTNNLHWSPAFSLYRLYHAS
jgi:asparagine synthase (glutamine-hydrolysing)